jgi:hypothetical protein
MRGVAPWDVDAEETVWEEMRWRRNVKMKA